MIKAPFGRFTPLQSFVLTLGGLMPGVPDDLVTDDDRLESMQIVRAKLVRMTGVDFGYDLFKWHEFLLSSAEHKEEYTFPYAWKGTKKILEELRHDDRRLKLLEILERGA